MEKGRRLSLTYQRALISNKGVGAKLESHCENLQDDFKSVKGQLNAEQAKFLRNMKCKLPAINLNNQLISGEKTHGRVSSLQADKASVHQYSGKSEFMIARSEEFGLDKNGFQKEELRSKQKGACLQLRDSLTKNEMTRRRSLGNLQTKVVEKLERHANSKSSSDLIHAGLTTPTHSLSASRSAGNLTLFTTNEKSWRPHDTKNGIDPQKEKYAPDRNQEKLLPDRPLGSFSSKPLRRKFSLTCTALAPNPNEIVVHENANRKDGKNSLTYKSSITTNSEKKGIECSALRKSLPNLNFEKNDDR